ncbi:MAG: hypothetical protein ACE37F_24320 [Nannocystaceae bacterium]|nr:hypothetical protein [bacterium]
MIESALIPPVLFVRWKSRCDPEDVARIRLETETAHRELGSKLVYVASIPTGVPPPDVQARAALRSGTEHASVHCSSVHLVIEGQGLRRAIIRSVSAGLLLATRASFSIHTHVEEALRAASERVPISVASILDSASRAGVVAQ